MKVLEFGVLGFRVFPMTVPQRGIYCLAVHASPSPAVFLAAGRGVPTRGLLCQGMWGFAYQRAPTWTSTSYLDYEGSKGPRIVEIALVRAYGCVCDLGR